MSVYRRRKQGTSQTASTRWRQFWAKLETGGIRPSPTCFSSSGRHVSLPNLQDCILTERYRRHETLELYRLIRNIPPWAPLNQVSPEHCDCILLATHGVLKGGRSHNLPLLHPRPRPHQSVCSFSLMLLHHGKVTDTHISPK